MIRSFNKHDGDERGNFELHSSSSSSSSREQRS
jgi:hypothetical protein